MVAYNVSRTAREAQYAIEDGRSAAEAIRSGLDPMLRDIEVQSGMAPGANVLQNRLLGDTASSAMGTYYDALANRLPGYVNTRRAFEAEEKKKAAAAAKAASTITMPNFNFPMQGLLPPQYYLPMTSTGVRGRTGPAYGTSPYGAIPMSVITPSQTGATPASRVLAQRRYSRNQAQAM